MAKKLKDKSVTLTIQTTLANAEFTAPLSIECALRRHLKCGIDELIVNKVAVDDIATRPKRPMSPASMRALRKKAGGIADDVQGKGRRKAK